MRSRATLAQVEGAARWLALCVNLKPQISQIASGEAVSLFLG